jgi:hypothetical protein
MRTATRPGCGFSSDELDAAYEEWGCNCGPAALAAAVGCSLEEVRPRLGDFEQRGYMNPSMMAEAITKLGLRHHRTVASQLPYRGVVRVQWGGPWMAPEVPFRARYRYTHWIASRYEGGNHWIFDVNAGWEPLCDWTTGTAVKLMNAVKRSSGNFTYTHCWEIRGEPTLTMP